MLLLFNTISTFSDDTTVLYKKYHKLLISIISKKLNSQEDIEDCLQDTFVYFLQNQNKINNSNNKEVKNYLATIANGLAINRYKKNSREIALEADDLEYQINDNEKNKTFTDVSVMELSILIDKLDDEDKNIIYLTYIYGYNSNEIASLYNVKASYIRKHLQRARENLRRELNKND